MNRCGRQDNIEFDQTPNFSGGLLPNGEVRLFNLNMRCRYCVETVKVTRVTGKQCQWWLNIFRMKHDTCHMEIVNGEVRERTQRDSSR